MRQSGIALTMKLFLIVAISVAMAAPCLAQLVVPPITAECATSIDGSVVGTPNPLNPPIVAAVLSGTLPAGNYYVQEAWYDALSNTTLVGPEVQIQLTGTGELQENQPSSGRAATAVGRNIYIGTTSGGETLQGTVVANGTYTQSVPLVTGAAVPPTNTTICSIIANDSGWPTGTGYVVSLTTPAGSTMPGYPMQWQLLGPGNTINLSQGLPLYNGTVTYPIPILARPYNHGPQSISGPLSMTNYFLTNVGKLGVGTGLPAWGVDVEGTSLQSIINAAGGYLVNGNAPAANTCLGSTDGVANDTQIPCLTASSPTLFYQTVEGNGSAATQRPALNFSSLFSVADSASPARTNVGLSTTGSEAHVVTAAGAGTATDCVNWLSTGGIGDAGNPCATVPTFTGLSGYQQLPSGIIFEWGTGGTTGGGPTPLSVTFPLAFPHALFSVTTNPLNFGPGATRNVVYLTSQSASGFVAQTDSSSIEINWIAIGY
jgi:hypothetical protein